MKFHRSLLHPFFHLMILSLAVVPIANAANKKPIANAGSDNLVGLSKTVVLDGSKSRDPDGTIKKYQWTQLSGTKVALAKPLTAKPTFKSPAKPARLVFKLAVTDNLKAIATDTVVITVQSLAVMNDTGITKCSTNDANGLACPQKNYPGQDAQYGRDVTDKSAIDGHAGFSFTKINSTGAKLPTSAASWNCVKDNVTNLMWEIKTDDSNLHDKDWTYTWYEPNKNKNGGDAGTQSGGNCGDTSVCDTSSYVKAVNMAGWCGFKDWRLPSITESLSIVSYDRSLPALDTNYFPDVQEGSFWTSHPNVSNSGYAWIFTVNYGTITYDGSNAPLPVRLVRGGQ